MGLLTRDRDDHADKRVWRTARCLADLGELTARWLEGGLAIHPHYRRRPDQETVQLISVLAQVNRAGLVTDQSQPGRVQIGWRRWHEQHAAVTGFANPATLPQLRSSLRRSRGLVVVVNRVRGRWGRRQQAGPLTCHYSAVELGDAWTGYGICDRRAVEALRRAWQVAIFDERAGRDDRLWPALERFAAGNR